MLAGGEVVGQGITWWRKGRWWDRELQRLQDGSGQGGDQGSDDQVNDGECEDGKGARRGWQ